MKRHNPWANLLRGNPFFMLGLSGPARVVRSMAGSKASLILTILACAPLGFITTISLAFGGNAMSVISMYYVMMYAQLILVPAIFFNAIAGERERGSWDLLRVAPVTTPQILVGKCAAGLRLMLPIYGFFVASILVVIASINWADSNYSFGGRLSVTTCTLALAALLAHGFFLICLTLFLSSRMRRPISAMMATYGVLMILYILLPMLANLYDDTSRFLTQSWSQLDIAPRINNIFGSAMSYPYDSNSGIDWSIPFFAFYLILGTVLAGWASLTLDFADRDLRFFAKKSP